MLPSRYNAEAALIALLSLIPTTSAQSSATTTPAQSSSTCQSYGIDFQHGGSYCIDSASTDNLTFLTQFDGCATTGPNTYANTLFVLPNDLNNGKVLECSDIDDRVPDTSKLSTCPITKDEMISGNYLIILAGNNGDGAPYAYFRNISLNVGPQQTTTTTPTLTFTVTTTPSTTITTTLYTTTTETLDATTTYYTPGATAPCTYTVQPSPVSTTLTETLTWHRNKYSASRVVTTVILTPTCVYSTPWPDPIFPYWNWNPWNNWNPWRPWPRTEGESRKISQASEAPQETQRSSWGEYIRKARGQNRFSERDLHTFEERSGPDACTVTITASPPVSVTNTVAAATVTETDSTTITSTTSTYLPPSTVPTGTTTLTTTVEPETRTRLSLVYITETTYSTLTATDTRVFTTTPPGARASCRAMGGYLVNQGGW